MPAGLAARDAPPTPAIGGVEPKETRVATMLRAIYERLLAMTGVLPAVGFGRQEPGQPIAPGTRTFRVPFTRRPKTERQTEISPDQQPGCGAPHR